MKDCDRSDDAPGASVVTRRRFIRQSAAAGALVVGFDLTTGAWATERRPTGALARGFPVFDGVLRTDAGARQAAADDFGHIVHRSPLAVLEPGSVDDIVRLIRFAGRHGIAVAARGEGHGAFAQAQVRGGVVIDMRRLARVHRIDGTSADVDAGLTWRALLDRTLGRGLVPPTLTDYQDLSVGGTLSVGGIGGAGFRYGAQVDNVVALDVVTGAGDLERCSRTRSPQLFDAVLAGRGQCAVITRAVLKLVPAPSTVRLFDLLYPDLATFVADARAVVRDARFDTVQGLVLPTPTGGWAYLLEATSSSSRADGELLAGLRDIRSAATIAEMPFETYAKRLDPTVAAQQASGDWQRPHPWFDGWLPDRHAEAFAGQVLSELEVRDTGGGPILLYPTRSRPFTRPLLRVPAGELIWQFDILRNAVANTVSAAEMISQNRALLRRTRAIGGFAYPVGATPVSPREWEQHYGSAWPAFLRAKRRYDPRRILAPGQGIFAPGP